MEKRSNIFKIYMLEYFKDKINLFSKKEIEKIFSSISYKNSKINVKEVIFLEENFIKITIESPTNNTNKQTTFFLEIWKNKYNRFFYIYTFNNFDFIEKIVKKIIKEQVFIDSFWFSDTLLKELIKSNKYWKLIWYKVKQASKIIKKKLSWLWNKYIFEQKMYNDFINNSILLSINMKEKETGIDYILTNNWKLIIKNVKNIQDISKIKNQLSDFYLKKLKEVEKYNIILKLEHNNLINLKAKWPIVIKISNFDKNNNNFLNKDWLNKLTSLKWNYKTFWYYSYLTNNSVIINLVDYYTWQDFHIIAHKDKLEIYFQKKYFWNIFYRLITNIELDFNKKVIYDL